MRAWLSIYPLFAKVIGKLWLIYVVITSLSLVFIARLFNGGFATDSSSIASMRLIPMIPTSIVFYIGLFWLVPKNYSWITNVPMPKRQIILLQGAVNLTLLLAGFFSYFAIVAITRYMLLGNLPQSWIFFQQLTHDFQKLYQFEDKNLLISLYEPELYMGLFCGWMVFTFVLFFSAIGIPNSQRIAFRRRPKWGWLISNLKLILTAVGILAFSYLARNFIHSSFGSFILITLGFGYGIPLSWIRGFALAGKSARISRVAFFMVALLQIGIVYSAALAKMSLSSEAKVQAMLFLGPFAGRPTQSELALLLQSDLSWTSATQLGNQYMDEFNHGNKLSRNTEKNIDFEKLIGSKKSKEGVYAAYKYYDPKTLSQADLKTIYRTLAKLSNDTNSLGMFLRFVEARVSTDEMREMFASNEKLETIYALLRGRYDRKPIYGDFILSNLPRYKGQILLLALDTLSVLRGSRVTLEDWHTFRNGRGLAETKVEVNCEHYTFSNITHLKPTEAGQLNICLRQKANKADPQFLGTIEELGWLDIPLNSLSEQIVTQVFQAKK